MSAGELEGRIIMSTMHAMVLDRPGTPLVMPERSLPPTGAGELLIEVKACGVCRTDLHVVDGELTHPKLPIIPGHEEVGRGAAIGAGVGGFAGGEGGGAPRAGAYTTHTVADARYCFSLGERGEATEIAPWLCAGLIGWRSYRMAGEGRAFGIFGFGAAAHILAQVASWQGRRVFAFTRKGDTAAQDFARSLGAVWAGASDTTPAAERLGAAISFAPVGALVPAALKVVKKGGRVVCGGIHMSDIPSFPYALLWQERHVTSVANLTRADAHEFLSIAPQAGVKCEGTRYPPRGPHHTHRGERGVVSGKRGECDLHRFHPRGRRFAAGSAMWLQRFDMGVDLDI